MFDTYTLIFAGCGALTASIHYLTQQNEPKEKTKKTEKTNNKTLKSPKDDKTNESKTETETLSLRTPEFEYFQKTWLSVYLLAMFSDWLQGPYAYALYSSMGFSSSQIAVLSLVGFGSSMVFGTLVGSLSDSFGRKKMSLLFVLLYSLSALTKLSSNYAVLCIGRVLSGIATSLLFSVFEAWMICAHNKRKFPSSLISDTFSKATAGNGICAVIAGLFADQLSSYFGFAAPFIFACVPLLLLGIIVQLYWDENTGADSNNDTGNNSGPKKSKFNEILDVFKTSPQIVALGLAQSLFEGAMYIFVFLWSPTLNAVTKSDSLPYGCIFSTFMLVISIGSYWFGSLVKKHNVLIIPFIIHGLAGLSMVAAAVLAQTNEFLVLFFFLLFEMTCGMFWPTYGTIRSSCIPESQRSTVVSLFRIPLNLFVVVFLGQVSTLSTEMLFFVCAMAHFGSFFFYTIFFFTQKKKVD
jgi:predicted MFS family arabinose efflux permease